MTTFLLFMVPTFIIAVVVGSIVKIKTDEKRNRARKKRSVLVLRYGGKEYRRDLEENPITDEELEGYKRRYEEAAEYNRQYIEEVNKNNEGNER